jgi:hypothetical protein
VARSGLVVQFTVVEASKEPIDERNTEEGYVAATWTLTNEGVVMRGGKKVYATSPKALDTNLTWL